MEYIVLGQDDQEYGPVDADTLKKWVEHGRVFKDTQVRNSLIKKWNEAGTMDFLEEAFELQEVDEEDYDENLDEGHDHEKVKEGGTAFKYKYIPNPANVGQRIGAFAFDAILMACFGALLFLIMNVSAGTGGLGSNHVKKIDNSISEDNKTDVAKSNSNVNEYAEDAEESIEYDESVLFVPTEHQMYKLNSIFGVYFFIFVTVVLMYYGIGLGIFSQTLGMWFWGLIIFKGYDSECLPARAFAFTAGMFLIGFLTPIVVAVNPEGRSLHGYLTGTRIVRIAAKPRA